MKYLLPVIFLSMFMAGCATKQETTVTDNQIKFRVLSKGHTSGLTRQKFLNLRTGLEFAQLWVIHSHSATAKLPRINFKNEMVVAVFLGEQRTGGYAIEINKILEMKNNIQVYITLTKPKAGDERTMMINQPNMIVALPYTPKPVAYIFRTIQ